MDCDMNGFTVSRDFSITQENCQRAKILTSPSQIQQRKEAVYMKQKDHYYKLLQLYNNKTHDYVFNKRCENKLIDIIVANFCLTLTLNDSLVTATQLPTGVNITFKQVCNSLTLNLLMSKKSTILLPEAQAFVRVRSESSVSCDKRTFKNIPFRKDDLIARMVELATRDVNERF